MSQPLEPQAESALDDTRARLLALEMVTVAALNRIAGDAPALQSTISELGRPGLLPGRPAVGDQTFLEHVQQNVARLAAGITAKL